MCKDHRDIRNDIAAGRTDEALRKLDQALAEGGDDAVLLYLRGNVMRKLGRWSDAVNCYLAAEALDPASPAVEARAMLDDIFAFYNKDMYNQ